MNHEGCSPIRPIDNKLEENKKYYSTNINRNHNNCVISKKSTHALSYHSPTTILFPLLLTLHHDVYISHRLDIYLAITEQWQHNVQNTILRHLVYVRKYNSKQYFCKFDQWIVFWVPIIISNGIPIIQWSCNG
jgi:hypothetical protein